MSLRKSGGFNLGRQEIREVAERRKNDIKQFLDYLFSCPDDIAHSDLVYTFFHPLLRDQEEANIHIRKLKDQKSGRRRNEDGTPSRMIQGELKLSLEYRKEALHIMVQHAQNLAMPDGSKEEPNSYVKIYLHPDPHKMTKRKTKVVRKNCHPSFMEMLEYRMPQDAVRVKTLQATVWDADRFQEKIFLGAVTLPLENVDLTTETVRWYPLKNFPVSAR